MNPIPIYFAFVAACFFAIAWLTAHHARKLEVENERLRRRNDQLCEAIADRHTAREAVVDRRERLFGTI